MQIIVMALILSCAALTRSAVYPGSSGGLRTHPAWTLAKGSLYGGAHSRIYFKDETIQSPSGLATGVTYSNWQGSVAVHYVATTRLEIGLSQILYQDTHSGGTGYNLPDDLFLSIKLGNYRFRNGAIILGSKWDMRVPVGKRYNIPLELYSAGRIAIGVMLLASLVSEPEFPERGINGSVNFGIMNHHDFGSRLTPYPDDRILVERNTREWVGSAVFSKMGTKYGAFMEISGRAFITKPPITAYTRENQLYLTPGVLIQALPWLRLKAGIDLRLLGGKDRTLYSGNSGSLTHRPWKTLPNLPGWQFNLSAAMMLRKNATKVVQEKPRETRAILSSPTSPEDDRFYRSLVQQRKTTEDAEAELERIRAERQRMQDLLNRLKKILETPPGKEPEKRQEKDSPKDPNPTP